MQADGTMDYSIQRSYSIDDTFSWFIPDKKGATTPSSARAIRARG